MVQEGLDTHTSRLADFAAVGAMAIVRDGTFSNLCFDRNELERSLTFARTSQNADRVSGSTRFSCAIATAELTEKLPPHLGVACSEDPYASFVRVHNFLAAETDFYGCHEPTEIHPAASIDPSAVVAERDVTIGSRTVVMAGAVIGERCDIGEDVVVYPGAVLGTAGFQHHDDRASGQLIDLSHAGRLRVESSVRILANSSIANAIFRESTVIGEGTRVGNNTFISHNVRIGARCDIGHGSVINGNCAIGERSVVGPGAVIANRIEVGAGARITLDAVVVRDVATGGHVSGAFAMDHREALRRHVQE